MNGSRLESVRNRITDKYLTMKISRSPDSNTFQRGMFIKHKAAEGKTPENDEEVKTMVEYYNSWTTEKKEQEADPEWQKDNLEYDLRTIDWILAKVRNSESYAQNLYAALCNNDFIRNDVWPILAEKKWSCSWRHAGGIIADMREEGDYIDWYCSGIGEGLGNGDPNGTRGYVNESVVTNEIKADLLKLGWIVVEDNYESK